MFLECYWNENEIDEIIANYHVLENEEILESQSNPSISAVPQPEMVKISNFKSRVV